MKFPRISIAALLVVLIWAVFPAWSENGGVEEIKKAAERGEADALFQMAVFHREGSQGFPKDMEIAFGYLEKAAAKGHVPATFILATMLMDGFKGNERAEEGAKLLTETSNKGYPPAWFLRGALERDKDKIKALAYMQFARSRSNGVFGKMDEDATEACKALFGEMSDDEEARAKELFESLQKDTPVFNLGRKAVQRSGPPEGEPAFSEEEARQYLEEVLPLVEKSAHRKFKVKPNLRVAGREEVARSLAQDILVQLTKLNPQLSFEQAKEIADGQSKAMAPFLLGKYGFVDKTLYILPRNVPPLIKLARIPGSMVSALVKVVLSHELTHALQDQHIDLGLTLSTITSQDRSLAFNATIEGHAVFIQDSVGTALVLDKEIIEFSRMFVAGEVTGKESLEELRQKIHASQMEMVYLGGKSFIDFIYNQGGHERIWKVLQNPPAKVSMILQPDTYSSKVVEIDYASVVKGLEKKFGDWEWQTTITEINSIALDALFAGMPPDDRRKIVTGISHVHTLAAVAARSKKIAGVSIFIFEDSETVPEFLSAIEAMGKSGLERLENGKVRDIAFSEFKEMSASHSSVLSYKVKPEGEPEVENKVFRIARGKALVEISDTNCGISSEIVTQLAEEVFSRFSRLQSEMKTRQGNTVSAAGGPGADSLGQALKSFQAGDFNKARDNLRPVISQDPNNPKARFMLAVMAAREKRFDKAWINIEIAKKSDPGNQKILDFIKKLEKVSPRPMVPGH